MKAGKGPADYLKPGDWNAICYDCGRKAKASDLVKNWKGHYVHPWHVDITRHPQDFVRGIPDKQAPAWVQPYPADTFSLTDPIITEASDEASVGHDYILTEQGDITFTE